MKSIATLRVDISAVDTIDDIQDLMDKVTETGSFELVIEWEAADDWTLRGIVEESIADIESLSTRWDIDRDAIEHRVVDEPSAADKAATAIEALEAARLAENVARRTARRKS